MCYCYFPHILQFQKFFSNISPPISVCFTIPLLCLARSPSQKQTLYSTTSDLSTLMIYPEILSSNCCYNKLQSSYLLTRDSILYYSSSNTNHLPTDFKILTHLECGLTFKILDKCRMWALMNFYTRDSARF